MDRRILALCFAVLLGTACSNSDSSRPADQGDGGRDAAVHVDASTDPGEDAQPPASALPRPMLERPPTRGLPADLRPPR